MREKGVPEKYVRVIEDMYQGSNTIVRCAAGNSQPFEVQVGQHQGSALSPLLFAIIIDSLTGEVRKKAPWQMMFADDVILCCTKKHELEGELKKWRKALEDRGMRISRTKTEYLCYNGHEQESIKLGQEYIPQVKEFKYLGSTVTADGDSDKEISRRIQAGWSNWRKVTGIVCDKKAPNRVKGRILSTVVHPAMLYGIETLPMTGRQENKLEVAANRMNRWSCGFTMFDKVKNEEIREKLKIRSLRVKCRQSRMRWFGHVERREEQHVIKTVWNMEVLGKRKRGRPRRRLKDNIKEDMRAMGMEGSEDAQERELWKLKIRLAAATP